MNEGLKPTRKLVEMQRTGKTKDSNEFVEKPIYLRYVYKVESIELSEGLYISDKGEGMSIITHRFLVGTVGWMVIPYHGEGNTAGTCLVREGRKRINLI